MKRSEMVKELERIICIVQGPQEQNRRLASQLLKEAEFLGMLPPKIELGDSGFVKTTEILDYTELDYSVKWEPEESE